MTKIKEVSNKCIGENCNNNGFAKLNQGHENGYYCDECLQALLEPPSLVSIKHAAGNLTRERKEKFIADFSKAVLPEKTRAIEIEKARTTFHYFFKDSLKGNGIFEAKPANGRNLPIEYLGFDPDAYKIGWELYESGNDMEMEYHEPIIKIHPISKEEIYCNGQDNAKFETTVQGYADAEFLMFVESFNETPSFSNKIKSDDLARDVKEILSEIETQVFYSSDDFNDACLRIAHYLLNNEIPSGKTIATKNKCKQKLAAAMGKIWLKKHKHNPITRKYLLLYKSLFSIFSMDEIKEGENVFENKLYKYSVGNY